MMTLDIFILQMILAMVTVNWATNIAIITCHIHYITTLATHILNIRMGETMVILMITVVMYAVDMEMKKQAMGMVMLVLKA
jgi:hypothetical protein